MNQPEVFKEMGKGNLVYKLSKSVYGLCKLPVNGVFNFNHIIVSFGFIENTFDKCISACQWKQIHIFNPRCGFYLAC